MAMSKTSSMKSQNKEIQKVAKGLKVETVMITPQIAESWLSKNIENRKMKKRLIDRLSNDLRTKKWRLTGDTIKFDTKDNLVDGQHRLTACVDTQESFPSLVVYGVATDTHDVMDTGISRSAGDLLAMHGVSYSLAVASMFRLMIHQKRGLEARNNRYASHSEIMDMRKRHPHMEEYVVAPGTMPRGIPAFGVSYLCYIAHYIGKDSRGKAMLNVLITGTPDYPGDPIHKFREACIRTIPDNPTMRARHTDVKIQTLFKCWNKFAKRQTLDGNLKWSTNIEKIDGLDLKAL